jgi:membrane-associated phospholipid phosphatase
MRTAPAALAAATIALLPSVAHAGGHGWDVASSVARDALVVSALGVPAVRGDWRGDLQAGGAMLAAGGTTWILKDLVRERRPDGSDRQSFPSGHTSVSFAAAASLEKHYGWRAGLPALAVASFVGVARVRADRHYVHDVLAGAAIGTASGLLLTSRHDERVRLTPWAATGGGGLDLALRF